MTAKRTLNLIVRKLSILTIEEKKTAKNIKNSQSQLLNKAIQMIKEIEKVLDFRKVNFILKNPMNLYIAFVVNRLMETWCNVITYIVKKNGFIWNVFS